jgi:hypothetical protein
MNQQASVDLYAGANLRVTSFLVKKATANLSVRASLAVLARILAAVVNVNTKSSLVVTPRSNYSGAINLVTKAGLVVNTRVMARAAVTI